MQRTETSFTSADGTRVVYDVWSPDGDPAGVLVLYFSVILGMYDPENNRKNNKCGC